MKIKRILLTGDDGYNAIGTRLLVHFLKDKYDLTIAATLNQQSGVGGLIHVKTGGKWGKTTVDGVPAYWFDGAPVDVIESVRTIYTKPFDLLISGINLGANIGADIISSGTFAAAFRGLSVKLAPRVLAISWDVDWSHFLKVHNGTDSLQDYLAYPGKALERLIALIIKNNFWQANFLNINFPPEPSNQLRFTQLLIDSWGLWSPGVMDNKTHTFHYPPSNHTNPTNNLIYDSAALAQGYISLTPIAIEMLDQAVYQKLKNKVIKL